LQSPNNEIPPPFVTFYSTCSSKDSPPDGRLPQLEYPFPAGPIRCPTSHLQTRGLLPPCRSPPSPSSIFPFRPRAPLLHPAPSRGVLFLSQFKEFSPSTPIYRLRPPATAYRIGGTDQGTLEPPANLSKEPAPLYWFQLLFCSASPPISALFLFLPPTVTFFTFFNPSVVRKYPNRDLVKIRIPPHKLSPLKHSPV